MGTQREKRRVRDRKVREEKEREGNYGREEDKRRNGSKSAERER